MTAPQPLVRVPVRLTGAILVGLSCSVAAISGATYDELRAAAVKACQAIDPSQSRSGLFGNPDGYRSYYVQPECFQRAAVEFRDPALCSLVKRRLSFFSSSWGYSPPNCLKLVADGVAADRAAIEDIKRKYLQAPVRLHDFRLERNGNGRDFDIIPVFGGGFASGYTLQFEILDGHRSVLIDRSGFHLDGNSNIRMFVRHRELVMRFPEFVRNRPYTVRASLVLAIGHGSQSGQWSDTFLDRVFPIRERSPSRWTSKSAFSDWPCGALLFTHASIDHAPSHGGLRRQLR